MTPECNLEVIPKLCLYHIKVTSMLCAQGRFENEPKNLSCFSNNLE
jgi:hypothetical protein